MGRAVDVDTCKHVPKNMLSLSSPSFYFTNSHTVSALCVCVSSSLDKRMAHFLRVDTECREHAQCASAVSLQGASQMETDKKKTNRPALFSSLHCSPSKPSISNTSCPLHPHRHKSWLLKDIINPKGDRTDMLMKHARANVSSKRCLWQISI